MLPNEQPLFLLDESLDRNVADALALVDYNIVSVFNAFGGRPRVLDEEIIEWCADHNAVWVHADDSAYGVHKTKILAAGIDTLWVKRPKKHGLSSAAQLRMLAMILPRLSEQFGGSRGPSHYSVWGHGQPLTPAFRIKRIEVS